MGVHIKTMMGVHIKTNGCPYKNLYKNYGCPYKKGAKKPVHHDGRVEGTG
jgi:hypothetical protein